MVKIVMQDIRISLRMLLKSPGFTAVAVLSPIISIASEPRFWRSVAGKVTALLANRPRQVSFQRRLREKKI